MATKTRWIICLGSLIVVVIALSWFVAISIEVSTTG